MSIFSAFNSPSGNIAIDLALLGIVVAGALRFGWKVWKDGLKLAERRSHATQLNHTLEEKNEKVRELREEFLKARATTEAMLKPYLQDRENRRKIAASTMEKEIDPQYAELEEQLERAAGRRSTVER